MRIPALAILTIGMVAVATPAPAQEYDPDFPVCMHVVAWGTTYEDCRYYTMEQCRQSASGRAAQCNINPYYVGTKAPPRRYDRRHRRAY